ncbi:MAG TPA: hypothetical protein VKW09_09415 [bacterium]|nr:hypothetical protein [bacterium]
MNKPLENTTLYLRDLPKELVRNLKAQAALRGLTLTALAMEILSEAAGRESLAALKPIEADMAWYGAHRAELLRRYRGENIAIFDQKLIDHDKDFGAMAQRVYGKIGVRPVFMPLCEDPEPVMYFHSPQIIER